VPPLADQLAGPEGRQPRLHPLGSCAPGNRPARATRREERSGPSGAR
jgi:hypothetical protein